MKTKVIKVNPDFPEKALIKEAAEVLRKGGLVAFPTETVYGIGASLLDQGAIDRLYRIKKRPRDKLFTIHISRFEALDDLGIVLSEHTKTIIHKFWPGPLTIVAFNKKGEKVGIRMPRNKVALALISEAALPIAAPSANLSGGKPPTSAREVYSEMKDSIDILLDGGITEVGKESTVLDVTVSPFTVLREGAILKEELVSDYNVLFVCTGNSCRSVMARAMLEKFLEQSGLSEKVYVDSAGTVSYPGIAAAPNTIYVMREDDMDVSTHKGKVITAELLERSDFIFVMEERHRNILLGMLPAASSKIKLLKEGTDIPDPIGKPLEQYRRVRDIIKQEVENIFLELFKKENDR